MDKLTISLGAVILTLTILAQGASIKPEIPAEVSLTLKGLAGVCAVFVVAVYMLALRSANLSNKNPLLLKRPALLTVEIEGQGMFSSQFNDETYIIQCVVCALEIMSKNPVPDHLMHVSGWEVLKYDDKKRIIKVRPKQ